MKWEKLSYDSLSTLDENDMLLSTVGDSILQMKQGARSTARAHIHERIWHFELLGKYVRVHF